MNAQSSFQALSASEYLLALHEPTDNLAVLLRNRARGQTLQRIASTKTIASPQFQRWLGDQNRAGSDIYDPLRMIRAVTVVWLFAGLTYELVERLRLRRVLLPGSFKADSFRSSQQRKGGNNASGMG